MKQNKQPMYMMQVLGPSVSLKRGTANVLSNCKTLAF